MPPKGKDAGKKGAPQGNFKAGKLMKDILPPNSKLPREGQIAKQEGEPKIDRHLEYEPLPHFPEWPGNDAANAHDFNQKPPVEEGSDGFFTDKTKIYLPPSFKDHMRDTEYWLRPSEYIREILYEQEMDKLKAERKKQSKTRKSVRKANLMAMGATPDITPEQQELLAKEIDLHVDRASLPVHPVVIASMQRLETDEEIKKRREEEERKAALDKGAKKKAAPAKGKGAEVPVVDPADDPQMISVPIENSLDMGFSMPSYTKWVTSQLQLTKDRYMRDVVSNEKIWERIYPQQNGTPIVSPNGKYWVKIRYDGKERLVEIDDRVPCDVRKKPIFARTLNNNELWPQLLMKALMKVYSYKWYSPSAQYDKEIGDGSIIYSLTGLIPEHIQIKDFDQDGMPIFRKMLSDDWYFGHKSYITAYCEESFRPKLPSQRGNKTVAEEGSGDEFSELDPSPNYDSSRKMLNKLKMSASMAITVTTGKKIEVNRKPNASNVIPGFGYALMDIFENEFVDMGSIVKVKDHIVEEKSPFKSPSKRSPSKPRDSSITKEDYRRNRKDERQRIFEEFERREREAPAQWSMLSIKTAVTRYPTINYVSPFSNDEIYEGKRCHLNHWRRTPEAEAARQALIECHTSPKKKQTSKGKFAINIHGTVDEENKEASSVHQTIDSNIQNERKPKVRAQGGVWIQASDFPHAFQNLIIYHNLSCFKHTEVYQDAWSDIHQPFNSNEKDVFIKMTVDEDLFKKYKEENGLESSMTLDQAMKKMQADVAKDSWDEMDGLPGEKKKAKANPNTLLVAFSPYPTGSPYPVLPRYFARIKSLNGSSAIDFTLSKYLEARTLTLSPDLACQQTIWLKPNIAAPLGSTMWVSTNFRKIEYVSRQDYLTSQKGYHTKNYTADYLPLTADRLQMLAKYDFKVTSEEQLLNIKVNCTDKYLLNYIRIKIVDKGASKNQTEKHLCFNNTNIQGLALSKKDTGYIILIEGNLPYNTTEGQLQIEVQSNVDNFQLDEIVSTEPLEFTDAYKPWKYGIIFKEKILYHPADNIMASISLRLLKGGKDLDSLDIPKRCFRFELLDNGKPIYTKIGLNRINLAHVLLRANQTMAPDGKTVQSLPESHEDPNVETKHNYVLQAIFDLSQWPECRTMNEQTEGITWVLKFYTSDTIALFKDTDKEDKEKALKISWETAEPGRAEKAAKSRLRFIAQQKVKQGVPLTDEDQDILKEKRERLRKKDQEELQQNTKNAKKPVAAAAKPDPKKGGKPDPKAPVLDVQQEEDKPQRPQPEPQNHVSENIVEFLNHLKAARLIHIDCANPQKDGHKRSTEEKAQMLASSQAQKEKEKHFHERIIAERAEEKARRDDFKKKVFEELKSSRSEYKTQLVQNIEARNQYRDLIILRNEKMKALIDMLALEKIDIQQLTNAIDLATENKVREDVIERGKKQLAWLKYCKEVEGLLVQAMSEKIKDNILAVLERIEREGILIEPKMLNDSKNAVAKMK